MMLLPYLITLIAFMGLVRASPTAAIKEKDTELAKRHGRNCYTKVGSYYHGQVFKLGKNVRCIKHRCMFGSIILYREGCHAFGECWRLNSQFRYQCRDFKCEKIYLLGGRNQNMANPISQPMCQDAYGRCKRPGETFSYKINGVVRQDCSCSLDGGGVRYNCTSTNFHSY